MRPRNGFLSARECWLLGLAIAGALYEFIGRLYWSPLSFTLDHITHIVGARSFLAGPGIAEPVVDPADFCSFAYRTIVDWPPGYSAALAPAIAITGDVVTAVMALDFVLLFMLFLSWWWITYQLRSCLGFQVRCCLIGWWVVVGSPAWNVGSGDIFSFAFFSLAFALTLRAVQGLSTGLSLAAGLAAGIAALGRYAYWPLVVAGPVATLVAGGKKRAIAKQAFVQAVFGGGVVMISYIRNKLLAEPDTLLSANLRDSLAGFFPHQLSETIPFPAASVGIYSVFAPGGFLRAFSPTLESMFQVLMWILSVAIAISAARGIIAAFRYADGSVQSSDRTLERFATTFATVAASVTFALLLYLSLHYPAHEYPGPGDSWVYLSEVRYYMPMAPAFFLGVGWCCRDGLNRRSAGGWLMIAMLMCLTSVALAPAALRAKRVAQILITGGRPARQLAAVRFREALNEQITAARVQGGALVYVDEDQYRREWAEIAGAATFKFSELARLDLAACGDVTVIAALDPVAASAHASVLWEQLSSIGGTESGDVGAIKFITYSGRQR